MQLCPNKPSQKIFQRCSARLLDREESTRQHDQHNQSINFLHSTDRGNQHEDNYLINKPSATIEHTCGGEIQIHTQPSINDDSEELKKKPMSLNTPKPSPKEIYSSIPTTLSIIKKPHPKIKNSIHRRNRPDTLLRDDLSDWDDIFSLRTIFPT
jgi:hypothetical protein